ncbi:wax ester/triacylglycerol synthase domain-containing protein, partial [Streptomyces acidiscabies]
MTADLLAPLDLAFWNLETAEHPMHLGALGVFSAHSPTAGAHAADLLAARAAAVPGLRMRIRDTWHPLAFGAAVREPAPGFDPLHHVVLHAPTPDFQTEAGHLMQRPLDRTRPPWEAHVLPGEDGVTFAVLFKFHHALADGLRALTLAAAVLDPMEGPERPGRSRKQPAHEEPPTGVRRLAGLARAALPGPVRGALNATAALPGRIQGALSGTGRALDIGASVAVSGLAVRSTPALTSEPSGTRRTAGVVIDVDDVHRVRKAVGGTVNDVLIGVVAGALRRWLDERGDGSAGVVPRALVPVSQRRPRTAHPQGNRLSGYLVRLPVDQAEPLARLAAVRAAMDRNKDAGPGRGAG